MGEGTGTDRAERHGYQILGRLRPVDTSGEPQLCNTLNISATGALVETSLSAPEGAHLVYTFTIPGRKTPLELTAEVVRKEAGREAGRPKRYGIRFMDLASSEINALRGFLRGRGNS